MYFVRCILFAMIHDIMCSGILYRQNHSLKYDFNVVCTSSIRSIESIGGPTQRKCQIANDLQEKPMTYWKAHHTVWGIIKDEASFQVIDTAENLPIDIPRTIKANMQMLKEEIEFSLELF